MKHRKCILVFMLWGQIAFGQSQPQIDSKTQNEVLQSITHALGRYYVFSDKAKMMADFLNQQNKANKYSALTNPTGFANQIVKDIRSIYKDRHLRIEYDPALEADILISSAFSFVE